MLVKVIFKIKINISLNNIKFNTLYYIHLFVNFFELCILQVNKTIFFYLIISYYLSIVQILTAED